jgi:hypothetical protein
MTPFQAAVSRNCCSNFKSLDGRHVDAVEGINFVFTSSGLRLVSYSFVA